MISCPMCKKDQMIGSVLCGNCGNPLNDGFSQEVRVPAQSEKEKSNRSALKSKGNDKHAWISLFFLNNGEILPLPEKKELTIGRSSEDQPILPDIDLSRFDAFNKGVSRLHCVLKKVKSSTYVSDLGSSNGTSLNGYPLEENKDMIFKHGDVLRLGKLEIQLLLHEE